VFIEEASIEYLMPWTYNRCYEPIIDEHNIEIMEIRQVLRAVIDEHNIEIMEK